MFFCRKQQILSDKPWRVNHRYPPVKPTSYLVCGEAVVIFLQGLLCVFEGLEHQLLLALGLDVGQQGKVARGPGQSPQELCFIAVHMQPRWKIKSLLLLLFFNHLLYHIWIRDQLRVTMNVKYSVAAPWWWYRKMWLRATYSTFNAKPIRSGLQISSVYFWR